jgi:hypothetical protein
MTAVPEWPLLVVSGMVGAAHCLGMCGPFVLAIGAAAADWRTNLRRQVAYGLGILAVACWYRPLVPMFLGLGLIERILMSVAAWVTKPSPTGHHPPEHYASLLLIPVLAVFLALAIRGRSQSGE